MKLLIAVCLILSTSSLLAQNESFPMPDDAKSLLRYYAAPTDSPTNQARVYLSAGAAMQLDSSLESTAVLSSEDLRYQLLADCFNPSLHSVALVNANNWLANNQQLANSASYDNVVAVHDFLSEKRQQALRISDATSIFLFSLVSFLLAFAVMFKRYV
jgi:hypothetical protein